MVQFLSYLGFIPNNIKCINDLQFNLSVGSITCYNLFSNLICQERIAVLLVGRDGKEMYTCKFIQNAILLLQSSQLAKQHGIFFAFVLCSHVFRTENMLIKLTIALHTYAYAQIVTYTGLDLLSSVCPSLYDRSLDPSIHCRYNKAIGPLAEPVVHVSFFTITR